jgi:PKD repeat protein
MNVEVMFRHKLEYTEVIPADSFRTNLMRRLALREFIHFNPLRFNVYYLGGLIAAGVIAAILIGSGPGSAKKSEVIAPSEKKAPVDSLSIYSNNRRQAERPIVISQAEKVKDSSAGSGSDTNPASELEPVVNKAGRKTGNNLIKGNTDYLEKKIVIKDNLSERSGLITLLRKTEAAFDESSSAGCSPLKVRFMNNSSAFDSCRWVFGDGGSSTERSPEWIFDVAGEYKVILKVFGANGDESTASAVITVHPKPIARFEINPSTPIIPDDEIRFINYSMDAVKSRWEFGDGTVSESFEPDHKYREYKIYNVRLIVWSEYGCTDSMTVVNAFSESGCYVDFPNAFIPNPDGPAGGYYSTKSDEGAQIFHPVTSGVSDYQLRIFSKKGILIFESNDINIGWDGYLKGQLCEPGVYIWKVRGTFKNGEPFVKMGDVTLLKK